MSAPEAALLGVVAICATVAAVAGSFDPLAVYTGVIGWGASRTVAK
jgi:hypothetical protein